MTVQILWRLPLPALPGSARGNVTVVRLMGELDIRDAAALRACLSDIRRPARPCSVIDFTGLEYIDCACLSVLVWHARDVQAQGGTAVLAAPHGAVRRIIAVTGMLAGLEVRDTAVQAAGGRVRRPVIFPPGRETAGRPAATSAATATDWL